MVRCFTPCCNHYSDGGIRHHCKFYRFPADETTRRRWARVVGRSDRQPAITSRICSCHFPEGKERGPTLFKNKDGTICTDHKIPKYRPAKKPVSAAEQPTTHNKIPKYRPAKKPVSVVQQPTTHNILPVESVYSAISSKDGPLVGPMMILTNPIFIGDSSPEGSICNEEAVVQNYIPPVESVDVVSPIFTKICPSVGTQTCSQVNYARVEKILLEKELRDVSQELGILKQKLAEVKSRYTASRLSDEVVKMETGLPGRDCFNKIVECATSLEGTVTYYSGWKVKCLSLEDQVFLTLMKLRHSYKDFHLAALFNCSQAIIKNVVNTWTDIMQGLLQDDYTAPPRGSKAQKKQNTPLVTNRNSLGTNPDPPDTNLNPPDTNPNSLDTNPNPQDTNPNSLDTNLNPLDTNPDSLDTNLQIESTIATNFLESTSEHIVVLPSHPMLFC